MSDNLLFKEVEFFDTKFSDLNLEKVEWHGKIFENCQFEKINFHEAIFSRCIFTDCEFKLCNLSALNLKYSAFRGASFESCKLMGINWTQAQWPQINLASPIEFYKSNISYSSFYELELSEIIIEDCKAHDVDFRGANLSSSSLILTDFENSMFQHTNLQKSDFSEAIHYQINPLENNISKAKFSMPDAMALLQSFGIELQDF